ncbi:MAG TPA: Fe2+-dependent dioxygenase [Piscinibacter sp.]|uniref:Fe2+-dependent dioxygenase n=1 Tax=Piscinibacter sp. TaxID=1903157 RepID=UPI002B510816|nr:Fe2+-dependent dioxygenase [Piscinibacter sp.]HNK18769.1 Fe2+-dependent dioxygenase [Piscinibacter sp.]
MLLTLEGVLTPDDVREARRLLAGAAWEDGRATAGAQAVTVKNNQQLAQDGEPARALRALVLQGLERHATFFSAALPRNVFPPMFNRYAGAANTYGNHVDAAIRYAPAGRVRTDLSCTLFLCDPDEYEGGDLVVESAAGERRVKLPAGDMVLYPSTSVHRVEPVTRGARVASFFWVQSMVRSEEQRRLLFEMDRALMHLRSTVGEMDAGVVALTGTYHNLLRLWAET